MLDWVRNSEEKISVSRDALSIEHTGKTFTLLIKQEIDQCAALWIWVEADILFFPDANDAFVTGIVLYRNLASILSFQR